MAFEFRNRIKFNTPYGECVCPVFNYPGVFTRESYSFNIFEKGDIVALAGYSTLGAMSDDVGVSDPNYGSLSSSFSEYKNLFSSPAKYQFISFVGQVEAKSSGHQWRYNLTVGGSADSRPGMAYTQGNGYELSIPGSGYQANILIFMVDSDSNAFFIPVQFFNSGYMYNPDLYIINEKIPTSNSLGLCSINGTLTDDAVGSADLSVSGVKLVLWDTLIEQLGIKIITDPIDPYEPGGSSSTGGGTGVFDDTGDNIDFPNIPKLSAVDTGFITLFNPSFSELKSLANYMWSDVFDINTFKKIFADPMDAILGLSIVPVSIPDGGSSVVTVGNISTGIAMNKAASQYVLVDCGTLKIEEYWGAYLDYDPYTKAELYLPYIGTHPISVDDIMGKDVHIIYHVDILSGACCAYVKCGGSILYSFVGQCSCSIPITGNDWTNVINGALSIAASIGTMVATGGATAPMSVTTIASSAINSLKPSVEKSGSMGGMGGMLGVQTPYLILTRPRQALPEKQNVFMGYPSFVTMGLNDCSGYTEIESIHLENIFATEQELNEIEIILKNGVIF